MPATVARSAAAPQILVDEGMWTFDNPPLKLLRERYGFTPTARWLARARLASLRFNDGGSGSFVSPDGLVLTNHHVAMGQLQKMSSARRNFVRDGFYARSRSAEVPCPDLEINQLVSYADVTRRVLGAIPPGASDAEANKRRKAVIAQLEKESTDRTGLRSDVVELYQGGEYWLYRYRKHKDIRLVMAPESQTAFFGGDPDNFSYPRFCLDFAFFRVYEGGRPLRARDYLPWSPAGAAEGELTFVTGHPGSTDRLLTVAQLRYQRDIALPKRLQMYETRKRAVLRYGERGAEAKRRAQDYLFGLENALKVVTGEYEQLCEGGLLARKEAQEAAFRAEARKRPALERLCGRSWERLERLQRELRARHLQLSFRRLSGYHLPGISDTIVRWGVELAKPNEERFEEFRDSALDSLKHQLYSPAPVHRNLEEALLVSGLEEARARLGPRDPFVQAALDGRSPAEAARRAIRGTRLDDPAERRRLVEGGREAVAASRDPLIMLSRRADPHYRAMRKWYEDRVQSVMRREGDRIAKARFRLYGKGLYPDATFTLRFAYGRPLGYAWTKTLVPYKTTFLGLYDRAASFDGRAPHATAPRVADARGRLRLDTPLNFVSTHDIIGGNSGSPVIDRRGRLVGLIFDGNAQSMAARYAYTQESARAISVHSSAILEALEKIYRMPALLREITRAR